MGLQHDRGRVGVPCGRTVRPGDGHRSPLSGRPRPEPLGGDRTFGLTSMDRPRSARRTATGRPVRDGNRSTEVDPGATTERSGCDGRDRRSGTRCRTPTFQATSTAETASMAQVAMPGRLWDRHVPAPGGEGPTSLPRGEGQTEGPRRRALRRRARGRDGVARSRDGLPNPTEVGSGRPPGAVRGKGRQQPRGL
jgi:hypothetical protein